MVRAGEEWRWRNRARHGAAWRPQVLRLVGAVSFRLAAIRKPARLTLEECRGVRGGTGLLARGSSARLPRIPLRVPVACRAGFFRLAPGLTQWRGRAGFAPASGLFRPPSCSRLTVQSIGAVHTLSTGGVCS
jgi:hypothetical protein